MLVAQEERIYKSQAEQQVKESYLARCRKEPPAAVARQITCAFLEVIPLLSAANGS